MLELPAPCLGNSAATTTTENPGSVGMTLSVPKPVPQAQSSEGAGNPGGAASNGSSGGRHGVPIMDGKGTDGGATRNAPKRPLKAIDKNTSLITNPWVMELHHRHLAPKPPTEEHMGCTLETETCHVHNERNRPPLEMGLNYTSMHTKGKKLIT